MVWWNHEDPCSCITGCLCETICLHMMRKFQLFAMHLVRNRTYAQKSTFSAPFFQTEAWYSTLVTTLEQKDEQLALEQVQEVIDNLEEKNPIADDQMIRVLVLHIREGHFLLNNPTQFFSNVRFLLQKRECPDPTSFEVPCPSDAAWSMIRRRKRWRPCDLCFQRLKSITMASWDVRDSRWCLQAKK